MNNWHPQAFAAAKSNKYWNFCLALAEVFIQRQGKYRPKIKCLIIKPIPLQALYLVSIETGLFYQSERKVAFLLSCKLFFGSI
jgi:hypothetical protein